MPLVPSPVQVAEVVVVAVGEAVIRVVLALRPPIALVATEMMATVPMILLSTVAVLTVPLWPPLLVVVMLVVEVEMSTASTSAMGLLSPPLAPRLLAAPSAKIPRGG